ncbi:hypothetical protein BDZ94DRAFT_1255874 [Collybia nuda]|uniref:DUF6699 domain-containing protein n=1 Tax=Collybia nuda TaxID=64659 RepID=A0A9P6CG27_9AGAR|nr:hypothetical protein BDZ94DRAFT_1255874 [Collybia nuda]
MCSFSHLPIWCHYRSRSRCSSGLHKGPLAIEHRPNYPPYTMRYTLTDPKYYDQYQPTFTQACLPPNDSVQPIRTIPSRWYNTPHTSQMLPHRRSPHSQTVIHRDLANPQGTYPCLNWDISQLPSSSKQKEDAWTSRRAPSFNDGALSPGCNNIQINFNHPTFNPLLGGFGPIMVYPTGNSSEITVENVMDAIYVFFQQPLTCFDWKRISVLEQKQVSESYRKRISRTHHLSGYEQARGLLRIDTLKGCTCFAGLQIMTSLNQSALLYMYLVGRRYV